MLKFPHLYLEKHIAPLVRKFNGKHYNFQTAFLLEVFNISTKNCGKLYSLNFFNELIDVALKIIFCSDVGNNLLLGGESGGVISAENSSDVLKGQVGELLNNVD